MHYRCSRLRLEKAVGVRRAAPGKNSPLVKAIAFTFYSIVYFKRADAMHARDSDVTRLTCLFEN